MSVPRRINEFIGEDIFAKWCKMAGLSEKDMLLAEFAVANYAVTQFDRPGEEYIVGINVHIFEDEDGCIMCRTGNDYFGYVEQLGCVLVPRLRDACGKCRCGEKRRRSEKISEEIKK
ncbi:hypothetical protein Tfer_0851 [Thermincola ferriacetica]|uniref:Uncharacterized protein n=1 Tax=Thermincola ferriacetica TaxID=281456 RepID=A0A0L6W496_9FIRM|nr:hypothetical protein [Thermincola ferriacetica]KNZ70291.1 hypothetical protein Tfer_0851 [Thermincola ferriacetica]